MSRILKAMVGTASLLALAAPVVASAQSIAWEIDNPSPFRNGSWSFGDIFTVGSQNLTVTGLGAFDANLDGFTTQGGIQVGIYDELTSALLVSTNVLSSDPLINNYRFSSITPLSLISGSQYRVVALNGSDLYNITTGTPNSVNSSITWDRYGYCSSATLQKCDQHTGTERTWMANLQFSSVDNAVPEPATWAMMLLGFGFVGGAMRARRKRTTVSYA